MVKGVVNAFWLAFLVDGLLSFADEIVTSNFGVSYLTVLRILVAYGVFAASFPAAGLVIFSSDAPKRVLVPLILFTWWTFLCDAFPLFNVAGSWAPFWGDALQLILAVLPLVLFHSEGSPLLAPFAVREPARPFSWKHSLFASAGFGMALAVCLSGCLAITLADKLETGTSGYVRLKPDGIYVVERKFRQGDKEVWLAGMMHIARHEFYLDVLPKGDPKLPSVVLVEGVTDRKKLLKGTLQYANLAKLLRLDAQEDSDYTRSVAQGLGWTRGGRGKLSDKPVAGLDGIDFKHADVDVETFSPKTTAFIIAAMSLFQSQSLSQALKVISDPNSPLNDKEAEQLVMKDILVARNEKLVSEIDSSLKDYRRVIVPWGAFHLSGVQKWLIEHDFVQQDEVERKAVSFW